MRNSILLLLILCLLVTACVKPITSTPVKGIDLIVFTWDWPMMANIPPIHVWKDNHAIWVDWQSTKQRKYHWTVYETFLSTREVEQIEEVLNDSGFWRDEQQNVVISDASYEVLWAKLSDKEKNVTMNTKKYKKTISAILKILEASPLKTEYTPTQGYLSIAQAELYLSNSGYPWPASVGDFDFGVRGKDIYIDGEIMSTAWAAVQEGNFWITYQGYPYEYSLKIPGVSCVISQVPYMCNMYKAETH